MDNAACYGYTADQLRADRLAVIEACARVIESLPIPDGPLLSPQQQLKCAAALRALKEQVK